jgi:hypothetical protein
MRVGGLWLDLGNCVYSYDALGRFSSSLLKTAGEGIAISGDFFNVSQVESGNG